MASNQATCDGSLSLIDFQIAANDFAEKWKKFNSAYPEWLWIDCSNRLGFAAHGVIDGYLSLQNVFIRRSLEEERDEGGCNDDEEPFDNATLSTSDDGDQYHFHVVYSPSYRVPVLYFHVQNTDGQPLNLDEIKTNLPTKSAKVLLESKWTFITQQEHPYLNRPWYMLHPCGTSEWMKLLLVGVDNSMATNGTERYMISWFSVVGQVFGLKLPFEMLKSIG
ncbi:ubiquitin-like-conjugating enzyme ATG10 isoform X2 [Cynara cardunculus var. scolymus]|uniref:ubiquitin-like-conjugating enzyme ATG10 isoform X2 n=1 Tax=Cynara cardunculus var. scolymus TaxID=59895 RepID=UPI000D626428|nr:ubiquitin-like-conjugating enzyme ATG10 isoform X2 [Cynara cardunculus var. scolymus]XP_024981492.1 ubiquitin-like-conjugating enzyme ATG10 isoform X2 [Cynara cardunculus var. scolymus]